MEGSASSQYRPPAGRLRCRSRRGRDKPPERAQSQRDLLEESRNSARAFLPQTSSSKIIRFKGRTNDPNGIVSPSRDALLRAATQISPHKAWLLRPTATLGKHTT